jgi:hypothetical protein
MRPYNPRMFLDYPIPSALRADPNAQPPSPERIELDAPEPGLLSSTPSDAPPAQSSPTAALPAPPPTPRIRRAQQLPPIDYSALEPDHLIIFYMDNGYGHNQWYVGRIIEINNTTGVYQIQAYNYHRGKTGEDIDIHKRVYRPTWVDVRNQREALRAQPRQGERLEYINIPRQQILMGPIVLNRGYLPDPVVRAIEALPPLPRID